MFLNKKSKTPIGLNISDLSIKAVQLVKVRSEIKIQGFGTVILKKGIIENGEIKNIKGLTASLDALFSKPDYGFFSTNEIVLALPERLCFTKLVKIESSLNKISDVIETEIEKYVPYPIKDVYYDWQEIKKSKFSVDVLVGVTPRFVVNSYVDALSQLKLSVVALETESISISRALLQEESPFYNAKEELSYIIIDLGGKKTTLTAYAGKTIVFTLSLPISGYEATVKIAKTLEIDFDKAEKAKVICGLDKEKANGVINDILSENIDELLKELQDSIVYFNHQFDFPEISEIIISGGGANTKNLSNKINNKTKIDTNIGNVLINLGESVDYKKYNEIVNNVKDDNLASTDVDSETYVSHSSLSGYAATIGSALRNIYN